MKILQNLRQIIIIAALTVFFGTMLSANGGNTIFTEVGIESALAKAKAQKKMVFLDFSASWCTPCKWMEETTFKDFRVVEMLSKRYVSLKVDIDKGDGAQIKQRYNINFLPTMLILNEKGQIVNKVEETLTPTQLLEMLNTYHDARDAAITYESNTSPEQALSFGTADNPWAISQEEYRSYQESQGVKAYRLQMGAFSSSESAFQKKQELEALFIEEVKVVMDNRNGKQYYKVYMGSYPTMSEAESFRQILKNQFGLEALLN